MKAAYEIWDTTKKTNIPIRKISESEEKEKGIEKLFHKIIA